MVDKADLSLTGQVDPSDKNYYLVKISKLQTDLSYTAKFQWSFQDQILNDKVQSLWSNGFQFTTIKLPTLLPPKFLNTDLSYFNGVLIITWNGLDSAGNAYTKAFDRINVYIKDETVIGGVYRLVGSLKSAGTVRVAVPPRAHSVKLTVVDAEGLESDFSVSQFETPKLTPSTLPTSASGSWVGTDFKVSFTHNPAEEFFSIYKVKLTAGGTSKVFDMPATPGTTAQSFNLSLSQNRATFGVPQTAISGSISVVNIYGNESAEVPFSLSSYVNTLPSATIIATEINNGYSIAYTTPTDATFNKIEIEEVESASATAPSTGYSKVFSGSSNPAIVSAGNANKRWVRARFVDNLGAYGSYGAAVSVTPIDIVAAAVDAIAPDQIQSATAVGAADPSDSGGTLGIITLSIVNAVATVPSDFNGYIVKVVRSSDSKQWTQQFNSKTYLSSIPVNLGISVGQTYTVSVATTDGRNQSAFVSVTGNPISVTDTRSNTTVPTSLSLSATDSILTVGWTPVNDSKVTSYRVQLTSNSDTAFATPIQEVYANSNVVSFGGLTASTTYRIRVTSKFGGTSGALSTSHLSGSITLNSSGAISDGSAPTTNPALTSSMVKSLFGAFAITFPSVVNSDAVTYEVFIKPTNATGIIDSQLTYKVLEVGGTFAVIKTLADKTTSLSYGTDYYIAIRAKDNDGVSAGTVTAVGPIQTSQVSNADLAADSIYANNIRAGEITADKMTTDLLFVNKTISVGESTSLNRIRLDSSITTPVTMNDYPSGTFPVKSRIYIGAGNYYSSGTSFYTDNTGRFSLGDKLRFDGTNLTVNGSGTFTGLLTTGVGSSLIKVGTGANGANDGIYIQQGNQYIYSDGTFSFGGGSLTGTNSSLSISGTMTVKGNSTLEGDLKLVSPGIFYIGDSKSTGPRIILNSGGIAGYAGAVGAVGTKVFGLDNSGYLLSESASIGKWIVGSDSISKTTNSGTITLDSSTSQIRLSSSTYTAGIATPDGNLPGDIVFWAGGSRNTSANFYVTANGTVGMKSAVITGYASSDDILGLAKTDMSNVTVIDGSKITTGQIKSSNHTVGTVSQLPFSGAGTLIDLSNGSIISPQFYLNGTTGAASFKGTLSAGIAIDTPTITSGTITGGSVTVTASITSSGLPTASDSSLTETLDSTQDTSTSYAGAATYNPTLRLQNGKISSNDIMRIEGASYTEILSGGTQSAMFDSAKSAMYFTEGLYLGDPAKSTSANVQSTTSSRVPWVSIDGTLRLRKGAPLLYPGGTTGAYVRNIYIKQTTSTPSSTTGHVGDIFITY
jgi:hypothetical protein